MSARRARPSETALFAALRRTLANKAYRNEPFGPDHLAEIFLPAHYRFFIRFEQIRQNTRQKLDAFMPGMSEYMIARTVYFDRLFCDALNQSIPQIVLLGAGYDTRAYRFRNENRNTVVFELDNAPTQNRKIERLKAARIPLPASVRYVPIDFNEESLADALHQADFDPQAKTLFLWEGVSYYLDAAAVDETLLYVAQGAHGDRAIAFDYTVPLTQENIRGSYGSAAFLKSMQAYHADETLMFSIPDGGIDTFLAGRGLQLMEHFDPQAIEQTFLLGPPGTPLGRVTGNFRFVLAKAFSSKA